MPQPENPIQLDRETIVKLVRKWGDMNTDGLLDFNCKHFVDPSIEGFIGYRQEGKNAIVFGDPVCAPENKASLALSFQQHCERNKLGVVYTITTEEFANWGVKNLSGVAIEFGQKFILNPLKSPLNNTGSKGVLVRKKIKQAFKDGATAKEYTGNDPEIEKKIENVANEWLNARQGLQIYLSHIHLFDDVYGKRWFYAEHEGKIVGLLVLNHLQSQNGWLLNHVMISANAPRGVSELLVITALEALEKEQCEFVLIGPVASQELGKIEGLHPLISYIPRFAYKCVTRIFSHIVGHEVFWEKFQPTVQSSYLLFPKKNITPSSIKSLFHAFNISKS